LSVFYTAPYFSTLQDMQTSLATNSVLPTPWEA
jgi:hypothetical protein